MQPAETCLSGFSHDVNFFRSDGLEGHLRLHCLMVIPCYTFLQYLSRTLGPLCRNSASHRVPSRMGMQHAGCHTYTPKLST